MSILVVEKIPRKKYMKSTDIERRNRELKRAQKKQEMQGRKSSKVQRSVGDFIKELVDLFFFDEERIYNLEMSDEILFLLEEMKDEQPEKQWDNILMKAVKKTKVKAKDQDASTTSRLGLFERILATTARPETVPPTPSTCSWPSSP